MRLVASTSFVVFALGACISNPTPHPAEGDADFTTGGDATAAGVGDGQAEGDDTSPPDLADTPDLEVVDPTPFPPLEREVVVREVIVADVDADGEDDLIVVSTPSNPNAHGLYLFFSAATRADFRAKRSGARPQQFDHYDTFVSTHPIPDGVLVADLTGTPAPELVVFGQRGDQGFVEVFTLERRAATRLVLHETPGEFVPSGGVVPATSKPVGVHAVDATGDGVTDLVAYDLFNLWVLSPSAWTTAAMATARWTAIPSDEPWLAILRVFTVRHADADWLIVTQQGGKSHFFPIVDGELDPNDTIVDTGVQQHGTHVVDVDGDGLTDVVGFSGLDLSVKTFVPTVGAAFRWPNVMPVDTGLTDLVVADVDASGTPDFVMLGAGQSPLELHVARDIVLDGVDIRSASWRDTTLGIGVQPYRLAALAVDDGPPLIWSFDLDGAARCHRWDAGSNRLAACP